MAGAWDSAVEGLREGDPGAFRLVYERLAPVVQGYLRTRGSRDPEGLTQEVFLTLFRRARDLEGGEAGLRTFAFSVAHARLVDELRARSRRPEPLEYSIEHDPRSEVAAEDDADRVLQREWVQSLIQQLPESQAELVSLRVVADLSLEETAQITGRSVGAVKQLQRRGLLALRELVAEEGVTP